MVLGEFWGLIPYSSKYLSRMTDKNFGEEAEESLNTYTVVIGNHPHVNSLKTGERRIQGCELEFIEVKPIYNAFASMVRELKYDFCEMALATYLQAREAGKPISLLPVVMSGNFHHHSITQIGRAHV